MDGGPGKYLAHQQASTPLGSCRFWWAALFHSENRRLIDVLFGASHHVVAGYIDPYPMPCFIFSSRWHGFAL
jgi:hypothetical protein